MQKASSSSQQSRTHNCAFENGRADKQRAFSYWPLRRAAQRGRSASLEVRGWPSSNAGLLNVIRQDIEAGLATRRGGA